MPTKYSATQAALQSAIAPDSPAVPVQASEVSGLDNLELAPKTDKGTVGKRVWKSTWPKLLAVAIVLLVWQIVVWSGWKPEYVLPGPQTVFGDLCQCIRTGERPGI